MTSIHDLSVYRSFNARQEGRPDLVIFAYEHTDWDLEVVNKAIDTLFPKGTTIWAEGEMTEERFSWDDQEHCRQVKSNPELTRKNFSMRQERLVEATRAFNRGDVVLVGRAHAIFPGKYTPEVWPEDAQCVKRLHDKLASMQLWTVILKVERFKDLDLAVDRPWVAVSEVSDSQSSPTVPLGWQLWVRAIKDFVVKTYLNGYSTPA